MALNCRGIGPDSSHYYLTVRGMNRVQWVLLLNRSPPLCSKSSPDRPARLLLSAPTAVVVPVELAIRRHHRRCCARGARRRRLRGRARARRGRLATVELTAVGIEQVRPRIAAVPGARRRPRHPTPRPATAVDVRGALDARAALPARCSPIHASRRPENTAGDAAGARPHASLHERRWRPAEPPRRPRPRRPAAPSTPPLGEDFFLRFRNSNT